MKKFKKPLGVLLTVAISLLLSSCEEDVPIFKKDEPKGVQKPVKPTELEMGLYYVKDGTQFIETLPLHGSGAQGTPESIVFGEESSRVVYAGPYEDTLIPTHYKGEIVAKSDKNAKWDEVTLERYRDLRYSMGFYNAKYDSTDNALVFQLQEQGINGTDFFTQVHELESQDIRVVGLDGEPLNPSNMNVKCGVIKGLDKDSVHTVALYSGTYYHEIEVKADTQMFQSFEYYTYGPEYVEDTPNGYRGFNTPDYLMSGYYAIDGEGLFKYADFKKGEGNINMSSMNDPYYKSDMEQLAQFSKQFSFYVEQRTRNISAVAVYDETSVEDEENIMGYAFAPDGTEYTFTVDTDKNEMYLDFSQAMPGRWVVNIVPMKINVTSFEVYDNTPDQELTQETYEITLNEDRENVIIRCLFFTSTEVTDLNDIMINGTLIAPDGTTYVMEVVEHKGDDVIRDIEYALAYAPKGKYEININHYPERTTIVPAEIINNTSTRTETIIVDG